MRAQEIAQLPELRIARIGRAPDHADGAPRIRFGLVGHRDGILTAASLMVAGPAAADAVRRAKAMPSLRVGLHLAAIEGPAVLPPAAIPALVDASGQFPADQFRRGVNYFFHPRIRRQLAAEIGAQFEAFAATGLTLDHATPTSTCICTRPWGGC